MGKAVKIIIGLVVVGILVGFLYWRQTRTNGGQSDSTPSTQTDGYQNFSIPSGK